MATIFFDLFWTLIQPSFSEKYSENKIVGLSKSEWIKRNEDPVVADKRYLGLVKSELDEIKDITSRLPFLVTEEQNRTILEIRLNRIREGLLNINPDVMDTLEKLKSLGHKLCVISNADLMDIHFWNECPLSNFFDEVIFSCQVGIIKPDRKIYELALKKMNANIENSFYAGDGGSNELFGARGVGMKTILTEHFVVKEESVRNKILLDADFVVKRFPEILEIVEKKSAAEFLSLRQHRFELGPKT